MPDGRFLISSPSKSLESFEVGLWMLSDDFDPVSDSRSEGFCSSWIVLERIQ
jgi:hypothetical protein